MDEAQGAARVLGRRGGAKGGFARAAALTPERRSEIAQRAAQKRWANTPSVLRGKPAPRGHSRVSMAMRIRTDVSRDLQAFALCLGVSMTEIIEDAVMRTIEDRMRIADEGLRQEFVEAQQLQRSERIARGMNPTRAKGNR